MLSFSLTHTTFYLSLSEAISLSYFLLCSVTEIPSTLSLISLCMLSFAHPLTHVVFSKVFVNNALTDSDAAASSSSFAIEKTSLASS